MTDFGRRVPSTADRTRDQARDQHAGLAVRANLALAATLAVVVALAVLLDGGTLPAYGEGQYQGTGATETPTAAATAVPTTTPATPAASTTATPATPATETATPAG